MTVGEYIDLIPENIGVYITDAEDNELCHAYASDISDAWRQYDIGAIFPGISYGVPWDRAPYPVPITTIVI